MAEKAEKKAVSGINLFRIAGIQVSVDFSWFIIFFLLLWSLSAGYFPRAFPGESAQAYWGAGLLATVLFFASVLFHELAHSLTAIRSGIKIPSIKLFIFGGISQLSEEAKDPKTELKIAIAGPLSSFALAFVFLGVKTGLEGIAVKPIAVSVFNYLFWINTALGVFNLVPGFPLDGGRVLRAVWWWRRGSFIEATKVASRMGKAFAMFLIILGGFQVLSGAIIGGLWFILIGIFLRNVAESGYQELILMRALEGVSVRDVMVEKVVGVPGDTRVDRLVTDFFLHYGYRGFPVFQDGSPVGIISISDVREIPKDQHGSKSVAEAMSPLTGGLVISPGESLAEALKKMRQSGAGRLLVLEDGTLVGMVSKTGLLRFLEMKRILEPQEMEK